MTQSGMEKKPTITSTIGVVVWLGLLTTLSVIKIVVGSVYVRGGCLGIDLLPYYFLFGGIMALIPGFIALLTSCCGQSRELAELWDHVAKLSLISLVVMLFATVYILVSACHVTSLDRLCTDSWVPIFGLCVLCADWTMFAIFVRLFCVNSLPPSSSNSDIITNASTTNEASPFYLWKQRQHGQILTQEIDK